MEKNSIKRVSRLSTILAGVSLSANAANLTVGECEGATNVSAFSSDFSQVYDSKTGAGANLIIPDNTDAYIIWNFEPGTTNNLFDLRAAVVNTQGEASLGCPRYFDSKRVANTVKNLIDNGMGLPVATSTISDLARDYNDVNAELDFFRLKNKAFENTSSDLTDGISYSDGVLYLNSGSESFRVNNCENIEPLYGPMACYDGLVEPGSENGAFRIKDENGIVQVVPFMQTGFEVSGLGSSYSTPIGSSKNIGITVTPRGECNSGSCKIDGSLYNASNLETLMQYDFAQGDYNTFTLPPATSGTTEYILEISQKMGGEPIFTQSYEISNTGYTPSTNSSGSTSCPDGSEPNSNGSCGGDL